MKNLILFDLDGTLLDTLEDLGAAVNHALSLRSLPLHTVEEYRPMVGHGVRNLVKQALPEPMQADDAAVDAALADFRAYYEAHIDVHTHPYPGIPELLSSLHEAGVQLAIASNKFQEGTEYLVQRLFPGISFVAILGNRPGWPLKPSPEIVQEVLSRSGVVPADALMVGDSPTDMRTAANGGIDALAVTWGYRTGAELEAACPGVRLVSSVPALRLELLGNPLLSAMLAQADPSQVAGLARFFKTGPGQYGFGDQFLGIKVPVTRAVVRDCWKSVSFDDLEECIRSEYHEVRLAALSPQVILWKSSN